MESLNKKDLTEIKSYGRPPTLVETVMQAVMILRGSEPTWAEAKKQLGKAPGRRIGFGRVLGGVGAPLQQLGGQAGGLRVSPKGGGLQAVVQLA